MGEIELFGYVKVNQANLLGKEYETYSPVGTYSITPADFANSWARITPYSRDLS